LHRILFMILLLPLLAALPAAAEDVRWVRSFDLALQEALLARRPLLVTFEADWCGWCRKLDKTTFRDPAFAEVVRDVVAVRINGDHNRGLVALYRVSGYPTTVILNRQGREIGRIRGYQAAQPFVRAVQTAMAAREPLREVTEAAEHAPENPETAYALGDVLLALRRYDEARAAFREVLRLDPTNTSGLADDALLDIGIADVLQQDYASASSRLAGFREAHPDSDRRDQALFFEGIALLGLGKVDEGKARVQEAAAATQLEYIKLQAETLAAGG
jgi:thioredoxin-like negative regulator of GroEL